MSSPTAAPLHPSVDEPGASNPFRLGFFSQVNAAPGEHTRAVLQRITETVIAAEDLGFESVWLGQHHFGVGGMRLPSPFVLLASIAAKTSRIRLGTAVATLALESPVRFAEDAAVLDLLSSGRLEVGLGSGGGDAEAFRSFGLDPADRRARYDRNLARLHHALEGGSLTDVEDGPRLEPDGTAVRGRLWQSAGSPERAAAAAAVGDGLLLGTFYDHPRLAQRAKIDAYHAAWTAAGNQQAPRIGALRFLFEADSRRALVERLAPHVRSMQANAAHFEPTLASLTVEEYLKRVTRSGSTEEIIESLLADEALIGHVTDFLPTVGLYPAVGDSTPLADTDIARLESLATVIAPALGWTDPRR